MTTTTIQLSLPELDTAIKFLNNDIAFMNGLLDGEPISSGLRPPFTALRSSLILRRDAMVNARAAFLDKSLISVDFPTEGAADDGSN